MPRCSLAPRDSEELTFPTSSTRAQVTAFHNYLANHSPRSQNTGSSKILKPAYREAVLLTAGGEALLDALDKSIVPACGVSGNDANDLQQVLPNPFLHY